MNLTRIGIALLGAVAVLPLAPVHAAAGVFVIDDLRFINGHARAIDLFGSAEYDFLHERPTSGELWVATDLLVAAVSSATATASASQSSYAGPAAFGGTGSTSASVTTFTDLFAADPPFGIASSIYDVYFTLTDTSYFFDFTAVTSATSVWVGGFPNGQGGARLAYADGSAVPGSDLFSESTNGVPADGAVHLSGILPPGTYFLSAFAVAGASNGPGAIAFDSAGGSFEVNLTLAPAPAAAVPEPATLGLLGLGLAGWAVRRRFEMRGRR